MTKRRHRFKQTTTLAQRLTQEASRLRDRAKALSPGPEQTQLWRKVSQAEAALRIDAWLSSPGTLAPASDISVFRRDQRKRPRHGGMSRPLEVRLQGGLHGPSGR